MLLSENYFQIKIDNREPSQNMVTSSVTMYNNIGRMVRLAATVILCVILSVCLSAW